MLKTNISNKNDLLELDNNLKYFMFEMTVYLKKLLTQACTAFSLKNKEENNNI